MTGSFLSFKNHKAKVSSETGGSETGVRRNRQ